MFESRVSRGLLFLGVAVGVMTVGVWVLDIQVNPPSWMIRIAFIKLALVASAGLLAAGALVGRHAKERSSVAQAPNIPQVEEGPADPLQQNRDAMSREVVDRRKADTAS